MPKIARSALVMFPAQAMYDLVNDVESYPQFLPWCESARILREDGAQVDAALMVAKGGIRQEFSTTNQLNYGKSIHMELLDGPFSYLSGTWHFKPLGPEGCKVSLEMDFEVSNSLLKATLGPMFGQVMNTMVDAFSGRAEKVYG
ncbi:type II toxin-antitoxin system RatA family toxin [Candidatus Sororendozoicomonas aggregata]|uniref:type II toxin-antitoxin system RatA family toxin n=1 Tax=Candidatus Sororendozoicomonas aggregata TaxID=3073239 RepID=UPI002ED2707A